MCTMILAKTRVAGSARTAGGWMRVDEVSIGFDHPARVWAEHALLLDFWRDGSLPAERVTLELDLMSGKALIARLGQVIAAAERSGLAKPNNSD